MLPATRTSRSLAVAGSLLFAISTSAPAREPSPVGMSDDLRIRNARVSYEPKLDLVVFEMRVRGTAGGTVPEPAGGMDGAPVLAYAFPTTLKPEQVGFGAGPGTLALVATSHPDFDDTPLWDENGNGDPTDQAEGRIFHAHWVVLVPDDRVAGGLAVRAVDPDEDGVLPPTAPGMPIALDSPGFSVVLRGDTLRIPVPSWRIRDVGAFNYDAVTAYLQVNTSDSTRPTLGLYEAYAVLSGDLSLPSRFAGPSSR